MPSMISPRRRMQSGQITCYLNRTYHVLPTRDKSIVDKRGRSWYSTARFALGVPRDSVSPRVVQVIIQEDRWKQAELERPTRLELLDDLPGAEVLLVRVGADQVEVELVGESFGEEIATA